VLVKQEVQFVIAPEHDWHGLVQDTQDPLTKNFVVSMHEEQKVELVQLKQGVTHVLQTEVVVLG
jgi:hypothetical protein